LRNKKKRLPQRDLSLKHGVSKSVISVRKKKQTKFTQTDRRESRQQENEAKPSIQFCHYREALLSFVQQARDRNLPLTRKIINIKAKEFAEKLGNEPLFRNQFTNVNHP
jgi:hypothetical protein